MIDHLLDGSLKLVINIPTNSEGTLAGSIRDDEYAIRRLAVEHNVPVLTTIELATATVEASQYLKLQDPEVSAMNEYVGKTRETEFTQLPS